MTGLTISEILQILQIVSIFVGVGSVIMTQARRSTRVEAGIDNQARQIEGLQVEIKTLSKVVTEVAVQNQRLDTQDRRLDELVGRVNELARGEGYILPISEALRGRGRGPT